MEEILFSKRNECCVPLGNSGSGDGAPLLLDLGKCNHVVVFGDAYDRKKLLDGIARHLEHACSETLYITSADLKSAQSGHVRIASSLQDVAVFLGRMEKLARNCQGNGRCVVIVDGDHLLGVLTEAAGLQSDEFERIDSAMDYFRNGKSATLVIGTDERWNSDLFPGGSSRNFRTQITVGRDTVSVKMLPVYGCDRIV